MKVSITPEVVLQGASALPAVQKELPSGSLPTVTGIGDQAVDTARAGLEDWWKTMITGTADDVAALHQLVTAATTAHVTRDHQDAADMEKGADPMAAFRVR